ncbi:Asp23/Gls24 family envelope stress response protein [Dactylosporangium vinaceum]|uniref:Asp23/Gls24 family envelope stress response protein n=1 Tax=Dactylosporangium vinaceum TaxID=53362 RepID=A0ABV5M6V4_9ACTN|nr:Asp23/Gls24 family envelope stress response protein [Dactylosporangium vinaceum]UAB97973.1 Asp23/Gls24 family envelope stress response protein [Dactylosporangium vinaceum]
MSETTAGFPARTDIDDPDLTGDALSTVEPASGVTVPSQGGAPEQEQSRFDEAAEKVGAFASTTADRVGEFATSTAAASGRVASQVVDRLRNNAELTADRGTTTIADEVVEKIAGIAARKVEGVYDLGGDVARVFAAVRDRIGLGDDEKENGNRGVTVRLEGRNATVRVTLVIEYGYVVYSVAEKVRAQVITSVENLLGLEVTAVDIVVDDVHVDDEDKEPKAA